MRWVAVLWLAASLLSGLSVAGGVDKPADIDLDDLDPYADAAQEALEPPPGCWRVRGRVVWALRAEGEGRSDHEQGFERILKNGRWNSGIGAFDPMVGRAWGQGDPNVKVLDDWLAAFRGDVETLFLEWDRDRGEVVLVHHQQLEDDGRDAEARTWFRKDGTVRHHRVSFPKHRIGPRRVLKGAGWDVKTRVSLTGRAQPIEEHLVFRVVDHGRVIRGHQSIWYEDWARCP